MKKLYSKIKTEVLRLYEGLRACYEVWGGRRTLIVGASVALAYGVAHVL